MDTAHWTEPQTVSHSIDSLATGFSLNRWNNTLLALSADNGPLTVYLLGEGGQKWNANTSSKPDLIPFDYDPQTNRFVASRGIMLGENLEVSFYTGSVMSYGNFLIGARYIWRTDKATFFDKRGSNVSFGGWKNTPLTPNFYSAAFSGSAIYIPYCIQGETLVNGALILREGPFANGVFCSLDSGFTWNIERISDSYSLSPFVCKTDHYYYYMAGKPDEHELWFSRKSVDEGKWSEPAILNSSLVLSGFRETYWVFAEEDTVHACWLDRRHEKKRLNPFNPWRNNYEAAYCHRKDSDANWSKDVVLSEGLLYAYSPSMSVEGNKIVVAWAGAQNDKDGHDEFWPNDIYYATSKDGGKNWTKPMQVTDGFKAGITSGRPQVALQKGVIHLFYIQGKINYKEASAGMALLNQPPWPIYYQQRPFPN